MNSGISWEKKVIGVLMVGAYVCIAFHTVVFGINVDENSGPVVGGVINTVGTLAGLVVGYHYGSSAGSQAKDQVIANQANTATTNAATVAASVVSAASQQPIETSKPVEVNTTAGVTVQKDA